MPQDSEDYYEASESPGGEEESPPPVSVRVLRISPQAAPSKGREPPSPPSSPTAGEKAAVVGEDADGNPCINLGKGYRATVKLFRGKEYVDIRRFYSRGEQEAATKQGAFLELGQFSLLRQRADELLEAWARRRPSSGSPGAAGSRRAQKR